MTRIIEAPEKPDVGTCDPAIIEEPEIMPEEAPIPVELPEEAPVPVPNWPTPVKAPV